MLDWLRQPLFELFGAPVSVIEVIGAVTGIVCVWLVARQHVLNWPLGMLNNLAWLVLFMGSGLYADGVLQAVYLGLACYGWANWVLGARALAADRLPVRRTSSTEWAVLGALGLLGTVALGVLLSGATDSTVPWWDAITTVLSLLATYGQARKLVECWWLWIAADVLYIPLYGVKGLWMTAIVYAIFLALCVRGLLAWSASLRRQAAVAPA
ncbi:nicotinamide mononucleotide transporter [Herbihabitans rhizosphaerae]|uniref:Nicotinamide mononucleotide transporter n=1 Tax=Herbihabitans rhizosphaerae TaxID=1872711 RepID=A0A4Q7KHG5_9PSEU|nr:nicotinamide riboside transporter PnuC [Herbihabitans rhizosphaerae]RZS34338.1 nicotinamide mononucleotide transporter [Herbihabitans rhizosphaerae]